MTTADAPACKALVQEHTNEAITLPGGCLVPVPGEYRTRWLRSGWSADTVQTFGCVSGDSYQIRLIHMRIVVREGRVLSLTRAGTRPVRPRQAIHTRSPALRINTAMWVGARP